MMKKKIFALLSVVVLTMALMVGCGSNKSDDDELVVYFVPSRDPKEIQSATEPLADMLKEETNKTISLVLNELSLSMKNKFERSDA